MRLSKRESREVRSDRVNDRAASPRKDAELVGRLLERSLELKREGEPTKARACFELAGELVLQEASS